MKKGWCQVCSLGSHWQSKRTLTWNIPLKQQLETNPEFLSKDVIVTSSKRWRHAKSNIKTMLICHQGFIEFVLPGQTINQTFYWEVLRRMCNSVRQKIPDFWHIWDWFSQHDITPSYTENTKRKSNTKFRLSTWFFNLSLQHNY